MLANDINFIVAKINKNKQNGYLLNPKYRLLRQN